MLKEKLHQASNEACGFGEPPHPRPFSTNWLASQFDYGSANHGLRNPAYAPPAGEGSTLTRLAQRGCENPLLTTPKEHGVKRIKKRGCLSRRRVSALPALCGALLGTPQGGGRGVAPRRPPFFAYFLWRSKESRWPAGASPGKVAQRNVSKASPKSQPNTAPKEPPQ